MGHVVMLGSVQRLAGTDLLACRRSEDVSCRGRLLKSAKDCPWIVPTRQARDFRRRMRAAWSRRELPEAGTAPGEVAGSNDAAECQSPSLTVQDGSERRMDQAADGGGAYAWRQ